MEEKIIEIMEGVKEGIDYAEEKALIDDEMLDSYDVVAIIGELGEEFDVEITVDDMVPENFNSVEAIAALIKRLQEEE